MDYCLGDGAGGASMWTGKLDVDVDGDGDLDGVRLDFDGDGAFDDALTDFDDDGLADHAAVNLDDGAAVRYTDDGSGTWALTAAGTPIGPPRWFGLDGVEHSPTATTDFDGDGHADRLLDTDRDGLADRVLRAGEGGGFDAGWVDTDGDGRWDVRLGDGDEDGAADDAGPV